MTFSPPYYNYTPGCVTTVERYNIYCDGILINDKKSYRNDQQDATV